MPYTFFIGLNNLSVFFLFIMLAVNTPRAQAFSVNKNIQSVNIFVNEQEEKILPQAAPWYEKENPLYLQLLDKAQEYIERDNTAARTILEKAIALEKEIPHAYFLMAVSYFSDRLPQQASTYFKKTISLCQNRPQTKTMFIEAAEEITSRFQSVQEKKLYAAAFAAIEEHKPQLAVKKMKAAVKKNPYNFKLFYELGYAYVDLDDFTQGIENFEKARVLNPLDVHILAELQFCYSEINTVKKAAEIVQERFFLEGESPHLYSELVYLYAKNEMSELALSTAHKLIRKFPDFALGYKMLADVYFFSKKDKTTAARFYREFLNYFDELKFPPDSNREELKNEAQERLKQCESFSL